MNLLERIEELHGLIQEAETLTEKEWVRGGASKWGTSHGQPKSDGKIWVKGAYMPYAGKEMSSGVKGVWKRLPNGAPIFIVKKRAKVPAKMTRSGKAKAMFKGKLGKGGILKKSGKRAAAAASGWGTRKANIGKKQERVAKGKATRSRRTMARRLGAGYVEDVE